MGDVQTTVIAISRCPLALAIADHNNTLIQCCCHINDDIICIAVAVKEENYCQSETFRPRCLAGETVVISKAIYGRMSDTGRCLQDEEELPALKDDPKYMNCFEDVFYLVSAKCSGKLGCEIRIPDPKMERTNPCYKHMAKYLAVAYYCVKGMIS